MPYSTTSKEIQVQIDDVVSCRGSCPGCILSQEERLTTPWIDRKGVMKKILCSLEDYLSGFSDEYTTNIALGIGDHFLLDQQELNDSLESVAELISNSPGGNRGNVFFSTSLIGKEEDVLKKIENTPAEINGIGIIPIVVLDPLKLALPAYGKRYSDIICKTKEKFGRIDLALNLSIDAVRTISPSGVHSFAVSNGFHEVTVNWSPVEENLKFTTPNIQSISDWLAEFWDLAANHQFPSFSYGPVVERSLAMCLNGGHDGTPQSLSRVVHNTVSGSLHFDMDGNVMAKMEAIGDVAHGPRICKKPLGNINENLGIKDMITRSVGDLTKDIMLSYTHFSSCYSCSYLSACQCTGFYLYNSILHKFNAIDRKAEGCPHCASALFSKAEKQIAK